MAKQNASQNDALAWISQTQEVHRGLDSEKIVVLQ